MAFVCIVQALRLPILCVSCFFEMSCISTQFADLIAFPCFASTIFLRPSSPCREAAQSSHGPGIAIGGMLLFHSARRLGPVLDLRLSPLYWLSV